MDAYTVALCTHNHIERLRKTLGDLSLLDPPRRPWELLIIDNACTDGSSELLARSEWRPAGVTVKVVREEELGLSNARNRAIRESRGEYVFFLDDDETPTCRWLVAYEGAIDKWNPDALGGRIEVLFEEGERPRWLGDELLGFLGQLRNGNRGMQLTEPSTPIFGGNFGFRRSVFETIGLFDASLGRRGSSSVGGEDVDIYRRLLNAGCMIRWVPDACIYHRVQASKLRRCYFLNLHYRQGQVEGRRKRGLAPCVPPAYLFRQAGRAIKLAVRQRWLQGADFSLRKEMNVAYFVGYIFGWAFGE